MDRMITTTINGEKRELNYSIEIMFQVAERFGNIANALDVIAKDGMESFEAVRWFALLMANDAELCRRDAGHDPRPMLTNDAITPRMRPYDFECLKADVVEAISQGYRRETTDSSPQEVDLGLAELQAKKVEAGA